MQEQIYKICEKYLWTYITLKRHSIKKSCFSPLLFIISGVCGGTTFGSQFSFHTRSRNLIQVIRPAGKAFYPLSHLAGPANVWKNVIKCIFVHFSNLTPLSQHWSLSWAYMSLSLPLLICWSNAVKSLPSTTLHSRWPRKWNSVVWISILLLVSLYIPESSKLSGFTKIHLFLGYVKPHEKTIPRLPFSELN